MKSLILIAAFGMLPLSFALCEDNEKGNFLLTKLPSLSAKNADLDEILEKLTRVAREAGADKRGFKGIIATADPTWDKKASFDFKDVPLNYALDWIAKSFGLDSYERNGMIVITDSQRPLPVPLYLTPRIIQGLGLQKFPTETELRAALERAGIRIEPPTRVVVDEKEEYALVTLNRKEGELLTALAKLLDRGMSIQNRSK